MTADSWLRALDHDFVVHAPDELAAVFATALKPLSVDGAADGADREVLSIRNAGDGTWSLDVDGTAGRPAPPGRIVALLLEHVNARAAVSLRHEIPLHAAAISHPDGGCVALVGSSGAGKSTLGAAAVGAGWGFVAEEIAAVDPHDLKVRPYPRPIGLRRGGAAAIGVDYPDDEWFEEVYPWPVPDEARRAGGELVGVALVRRDDDTDVVELTPATALAELMEHTVVPDPARIVPVFRQLDDLVRMVPVVRLSSAEPADALVLLDELAGRWR